MKMNLHFVISAGFFPVQGKTDRRTSGYFLKPVQVQQAV